MADIEDSGFGIESLNLVDNSIATLPAANTVINILILLLTIIINYV